MTRSDLIDVLAKKIQISNKDSKKIVNVIIDTIKECLKKNSRIEIRGLGSFEVRSRTQRKGRIIATGEQITIPPRKVPVFVPGLILKKMVN
ncbi:MAG: HU family DNA-binding protein [bacterium]|nr:HU family DNA-binding protein [bacterium]